MNGLGHASALLITLLVASSAVAGPGLMDSARRVCPSETTALLAAIPEGADLSWVESFGRVAALSQVDADPASLTILAAMADAVTWSLVEHDNFSAVDPPRLARAVDWMSATADIRDCAAAEGGEVDPRLLCGIEAAHAARELRNDGQPVDAVAQALETGFETCQRILQ